MIRRNTKTKNSKSTVNKNVNSATNSSDEKKKFFLENIAKFCDKCGNIYSLNDLQIVQENNISSIIHFSCSKCKANHIATFLRPMGISSRVPVNSDLTIDEISKFAKHEAITSNDVLDIYNLLEKSPTLDL